MKAWPWIALLFIFISTPGSLSLGSRPATANSISTSQLLGKWFEIAATPQSYQKQCRSNATLELFELPNQELKVLNTCIQFNDEKHIAEGRGRIINTLEKSKISITYIRFFDWIHLLGTELQVLNFDKNENYMIIGNPDKKIGWILSRDEELSLPDLKHISQILQQYKIDPCLFFIQPQNRGFSERSSICELF